MTPSRIFSAACVVLALACTTPVQGQQSIEYSDDADALFKRGLTLFQEKQYGDAIAAFDQVIEQYPSSQRVTAAYVMKGKGLLFMDEPLRAAQTLKSFLTKFPSSTYVADAEFTLGLIHSRLLRLEDAMTYYLSAWEHALGLTNDEKLKIEIREAVDLTADQYLSVATLQKFAAESRLGVQRAHLWLNIGEKEVGRGNVAAAGVALDTLSRYYHGDIDPARLATLEQKVKEGSVVTLGALLPLMGSLENSARNEVGMEIFDGIKFAVEENAQRSGPKVHIALEVRDTERDPLVAARGAQELTAKDNVLAVVGPIFTNTTLSVATLANRRGVPLVTPTANADGITAAGAYVFQANPDYETRGRAMAQYAVKTKGLNTLAVLAPSEGHGKAMAEAFVAEASRLGGRIVAAEWYERGATDLQRQLTTIKRAGMGQAADPVLSFGGKLARTDIAKLVQLGIPMKRIDSLIERSSAIKASRLLGANARERLDSVGVYSLYGKVNADSLITKVSSLDAIYIPISTPDEIGVVSAQIVYLNIETQLLGTGEWYDLAELNGHRRYCSGVIFDSDAYVEEESPRYVDFVKRFTERFGRKPTKNTLYGYDTASLLVSLIQSGATNREAMARALAATRDYPGLHARIGFSPKRVNSWLNVLQYDSGTIKKIAEIDTEGISK